MKALPLYYKSIGDDRFKYRSVLNFAGDYMYEDKKSSSSRYSTVCNEGAEKMLKSYLIMTCIMSTSLSLVTFGPMLLFLRTGVWITPLGTQFPYADQSDIAFYMDLAIQMAVGFLGIMITVSIEMSQVILNNAVVVSSDVITLNANEIAEQLASEQAMSVRSQAKFRNMMLQIQDFDRYEAWKNLHFFGYTPTFSYVRRYISNFAHIFYWRTLLGPFSLAFSTAFCIFTQYMLDFPAGYGSAVMKHCFLSAPLVKLS